MKKIVLLALLAALSACKKEDNLKLWQVGSVIKFKDNIFPKDDPGIDYGAHYRIDSIYPIPSYEVPTTNYYYVSSIPGTAKTNKFPGRKFQHAGQVQMILISTP
jgi:hypothetical protein